MKLRLHITKNEDLKDYSRGQYFRFAVIDLDKSKNYPANFVCMLPKKPTVNDTPHNIFSKIYGKESILIAKQLLKRALNSESDLEIKNAITERISMLEPKKAPEVKCCRCGKPFTPIRMRYRKQKVCPECKQRIYKN
ncbi:hypothetical protein E2P47_00460 [Candidatus Bathyarchaeota archaeon]|nr:hypothetical protein E2P47_00460 [Candidatus Bathyarchaeota archaeon]